MKYTEHTGHPGQYSLVTEGMLICVFFNQELLLRGESHNVATARNDLKPCNTFFIHWPLRDFFFSLGEHNVIRNSIGGYSTSCNSLNVNGKNHKRILSGLGGLNIHYSFSMSTLEKSCKTRAHIQLDLAINHAAD